MQYVNTSMRIYEYAFYVHILVRLSLTCTVVSVKIGHYAALVSFLDKFNKKNLLYLQIML